MTEKEVERICRKVAAMFHVTPHCVAMLAGFVPNVVEHRPADEPKSRPSRRYVVPAGPSDDFYYWDID